MAIHSSVTEKCASTSSPITLKLCQWECISSKRIGNFFFLFSTIIQAQGNSNVVICTQPQSSLAKSNVLERCNSSAMKPKAAIDTYPSNSENNLCSFIFLFHDGYAPPKHDAKSLTLPLKYLFNCAWADSTMLVDLHPRCKNLSVHTLTNCFLTGKTVVSTYLTNIGNGSHTSLNFNHALEYASSVGDSTTSLQTLTIFLTRSQCFSHSLPSLPSQQLLHVYASLWLYNPWCT